MVCEGAPEKWVVGALEVTLWVPTYHTQTFAYDTKSRRYRTQTARCINEPTNERTDPNDANTNDRVTSTRSRGGSLSGTGIMLKASRPPAIKTTNEIDAGRITWRKEEKEANGITMFRRSELN